MKRNDFLFLCYIINFLLYRLLLSIRKLKAGLPPSAITSAEMFSCEKNDKSKINLLNDAFHFIKKMIFKTDPSLFKEKSQNSGIFSTYKEYFKSLPVSGYDYIIGKRIPLLYKIDCKIPDFSLQHKNRGNEFLEQFYHNIHLNFSFTKPSLVDL